MARYLVVLGIAGLIGAGLGYALGAGKVRTTIPEVPLRSEDAAAAPVLVSPEAPRPEARVLAMSGLPSYPGAQAVSFGRVDAHGVPMEMGYFETPDLVEEVLAFYERALGEAGYLPVRFELGTKAGYITYRDEIDALHTVAILRQGESTIVFPTLSGPAANVALEEKPSPDLPIPDAVDVYGVVTVSTGDREEQSAVGFAASGSLEGLFEYYRSAFSSNGWRLAMAERTVIGTAFIRGEKGDLSSTVFLRQIGASEDRPPGIQWQASLITKQPSQGTQNQGS